MDPQHGLSTDTRWRSDTLIVFDRTLASNPNFLPSFDGARTKGIHRYRATGGNGQVADQKRINSNPTTGTPALKQWIIHCPVRPEVTDRSIAWTTAGGQGVRVQALLPVDGVKVAFEESLLWAPPLCQVDQQKQGMRASEAGWQVRILPKQAWPGDGSPRWDVFLNVIHAADRGAVPDGTLVRSKGDEAVGTVIRREGLADTLVLFSSTPSTHANGRTEFRRVRREGYAVAWEASAGTTDVLLYDLDPAKTWIYAVDGKEGTSLPVSAQGVGRASSPGAGHHTLVLEAR